MVGVSVVGPAIKALVGRDLATWMGMAQGSETQDLHPEALVPEVTAQVLNFDKMGLVPGSVEWAPTVDLGGQDLAA